MLKLRVAALVLGFTAACSGTDEPAMTQDATPSMPTSESALPADPPSEQVLPTAPTASTAASTTTSDSTPSSGQAVAVALTETGRFGVAFAPCYPGGSCPGSSVQEQRVGSLFVRLEAFGRSGSERLSISVTNEGDQLLREVTVTDVIDFSGLVRSGTGDSSSEPVTRIEPLFAQRQRPVGSAISDKPMRERVLSSAPSELSTAGAPQP